MFLAHDSAGTAHNSIRSLISANDDRLDAIDVRDILEIAAYLSNATYSRGSANSIVTHSSGLFIYVSDTERSSNHDPDLHPGYWLKLSEGMTYEVITTGTHRIAARTLVVNGDNDNVYLCTTTQTTPRDLAYIHAQSESVGGSFILLNGAGSGGTTVVANPTGTDGDDLTRVTIGSDNYNIPSGGVAVVADGSITTAKLADDAVTNAKMADDAVNTAEIVDDAVTGDKIADNTIHGGALIDGTIPTGKIGDAQVTGAKLSNNAVSTNKVADDAITQAKVADDAVGVNQIADGAVDTARLATGAVTASKISSNAVTTAKINNGAVTAAKLATNAAGEGKVPIDNTLQFDGSGNLGVEISTVIDLLDEDIRYYSTDTTREDAQQASKGVVFLDTSRYAKRIHSIEWDFEGDGITHNYTTFIVRIDSNDDIDFVYGESETLFNVGTTGTHRFNFDSSGLRIPGNIERLGVFLTRTGSDATWVTKVYRGQPASDSPRESYPDASVDFPFWRSARFDSGRPELGEHIDNYITNGEIYGYPKIRYTLELEHASLVGDGNITPAHIDSGSSDDGTVLTADGSGNSAFEDLVVHGDNIVDNTIPTAKYGNTSVTTAKIANAAITEGKLAQAVRDLLNDGGVTHIESGATYNNNVITVSTTGNVRGGDGILFAVPSPFGTSTTQAVSLEIDGQANSTHPLVDRNGDALHEDDLTVNSVYIAISDGDSWDILVLPAGSGAGLSSSTPSEHGIGQSGAAGVATEASRGDHQHAIPAGVPVATGNENAEGTATTASRSDHVHQNGVFSWGFLVDTLIVPELNQDAITTARIILEDSGLTHYLTFLGWTQSDLDMISHLPVGAYIGLRQGANTRILRVEAEWDSTDNRYQVINVNTGILSESASGTATELLLTAGVGSGTVHTTGIVLPTSPVTNQLFTFNDDATGITAKDDDGTTDITTASEGDLFKYNGTDWVRQASAGDTLDDTSNAYEALATNITYAFTGSAGAAGAIFKISRALVEADDYGLVVFSQRIGTLETSGREPLTPVLARDIRQLGRTPHPGIGVQIPVTTSVIRMIGPWDLDYHDSPSSGTWNLHYSGSLLTTLVSSATVGSTNLSLTDASDLEAGDTIFIDSETIVVTSISGNDVTVPATTTVHAAGASVFIDDKRGFFFGQTRNAQNDVDDLDIILLSSGGVTESGQESPGTGGVAELTPDLVTVTFYKWVLTTDGKPANPTAHWRFDDEWDGTAPFQGGGWYISRATALDEADNNPAFSQDTWTLWIATEQVRRRIVNDAYSYTDGGYTVTAAWDIQYSIDGSTWTTTEPTDTYHYIRYRDQETGEFGPTIPIGTNVGSNHWQPIRTNDLVYPGGSDEDELQAAYDFGDFSDLLFVAASYRSVTVSDGMGGTMVVGVNGPWHQCVLSRGAGWSVADASDGQDNNDEDDGSCFQFTYFATNTGVGLLMWERGDDYVDLRQSSIPTRQQ